MQRHPNANDIGLIVEVADTSLARDRYKCRLYGGAQIVEYWIVNLVDRRIEVYAQPTGPDPNPGYRQRDDYDPGEVVPLVIDKREFVRIEVNRLLP